MQETKIKKSQFCQNLAKKNIFAKKYVPHWTEDIFTIIEVKHVVDMSGCIKIKWK